MSSGWGLLPWVGLVWSQIFWAGCSSCPGRVWVERGSQIREYGEEFLSQSVAQEVVRVEVTSFKIRTTSWHTAAFDFRAKEFQWKYRGGPWHDVRTFEELERETGVSEEFAKYWSIALVELKSFLISKQELHCEGVHISMSESPPFLGNPPAGWFYVPQADERRADCVKGMEKLEEGWYFGSIQR